MGTCASISAVDVDSRPTAYQQSRMSADAFSMVDRALSELETCVSKAREDTRDPSTSTIALIDCFAAILAADIRRTGRTGSNEAILWETLRDCKWGWVASCRRIGSGTNPIFCSARHERGLQRVQRFLESLCATGCLHSFIVQACSSNSSPQDTPFTAQHYEAGAVLLEPSLLNQFLRYVRRAESLPWILQEEAGEGEAGRLILATQAESDAFLATCPLLVPPPSPSSLTAGAHLPISRKSSLIDVAGAPAVKAAVVGRSRSSSLEFMGLSLDPSSLLGSLFGSAPIPPVVQSQRAETLGALHGWSIPALLHSVDLSADPASILRTLPTTHLPPAHRAQVSDPSRVLSERCICMLEACLPAPARGYAWNLAYALTRDGASLTTLLSKTAAAQQRSNCGNELSLIAMRDEHGGVFGMFAAASWSMAKGGTQLATGRYFGSQLGWVFTCENRQGVDKVRDELRTVKTQSSWDLDERADVSVHASAVPRLQMAASWSSLPTTSSAAASAPAPPDIGDSAEPFHVYRRAGRNAYMQYIELGKGDSALHMGMGGGGHFAVLLDSSLEIGRSGPCATFLSPPLCSLQGLAPETTEQAMRHRMDAMAGVAGAETVGTPTAGSDTDSDLAVLGPDVPFRAVEVEVWTFSRRTERDEDLRAHAAVLAERT